MDDTDGGAERERRVCIHVYRREEEKEKRRRHTGTGRSARHGASVEDGGPRQMASSSDHS